MAEANKEASEHRAEAEMAEARAAEFRYGVDAEGNRKLNEAENSRNDENRRSALLEGVVNRLPEIIREQVIQHLKVREDEELYIDPEVNEHIWKRGIENPPRKIRLLVTRHDEPGIPVEVTLVKE